ncbi:hypothetical protein CYMTET_25532, partial [Cymbomonas tetramitiformis]
MWEPCLKEEEEGSDKDRLRKTFNRKANSIKIRTSGYARPTDSLAGSPLTAHEAAGPPIVALGKFDALHIGHRSLAQQASTLGTPYLISFSGMAEVLGWEERLPVVAPAQRTEVLTGWSALCRNIPVREHVLPFRDIRTLSPEDFVSLLYNLGIRGVVVGSNYRFGYKAKGDTTMLQTLGADHGMKVIITDLVQNSIDNVSSTRVRNCLVEGELDEVATLLGRRHRLAASLPSASLLVIDGPEQGVHIPSKYFVNLPPGPGVYPARASFADWE